MWKAKRSNLTFCVDPVFADILPAGDGGAASGLLERMKEGGATASGLLKEGGAGLERMFSRGMKWLDEG